MCFLSAIHFLNVTGLFIVVQGTIYRFNHILSLMLIIDGLYSVQQKDDRKILKSWHWSCVLMDEAHALKDKNSYRWKNLMSVARNANQRLMLTGTPLQNDLNVLSITAFSFSLCLRYCFTFMLQLMMVSLCLLSNTSNIYNRWFILKKC